MGNKYPFDTEVIGDITLATRYWDCECKENYIHPNKQKVCFDCNTVQSDGRPNSHADEVLKMINEGKLVVPGGLTYGELKDMLNAMSDKRLQDHVSIVTPDGEVVELETVDIAEDTEAAGILDDGHLVLVCYGEHVGVDTDAEYTREDNDNA
jgi:hypothetical protein